MTPMKSSGLKSVPRTENFNPCVHIGATATVKVSPRLPPGLSGSLTSLSPPVSWTSPAHGCSFQSHRSVQSGLRSPLQLIEEITNECNF